MLYRKTGFPEENELVLCTVTNIQYHSVFVNLDEYDRQGMIHISEISPGRIRNIRDFVKEGKKIICLVLRINTEKGYIDLSLRRVNEAQKREKNNHIKQEMLAEKIVENAARQRKEDFEKLYKKVTDSVFKKYPMLFAAFEEVALRGESLEKLGIEKKLAEDITTIIKLRIKPSEVNIDGDFILTSYKPDGINIIREAVKKGKKVCKDISIKYKGAGTYHLEIKAGEYKEAEKNLEKAVKAVREHMEANGSNAEFIREESK
jgi:translation initiation factor 2 subunit 1